MESLRIAVLCIGAAVLYGIVHDQITARICLEYFTIFHPPMFHTSSPTLLGLGWGIIATWWVGAFFAIPMILAARAGSRPTLRAIELLGPVWRLLILMAGCALIFGAAGYFLARRGILATDWLSFTSSPNLRYRFMADWWAHIAAYGAAFVGGTALCVMTYRKRAPRDEGELRG
jgi:hypothetical protein